MQILSWRAVSHRVLPPAVASLLHPGLRDARSVVFHQFGVEPEYRRWRLRLLGRDEVADKAESALTEARQVQMIVEDRERGPGFVGLGHLPFELVISQGNTPPLFGTGLIDAIPDAALLAAAERKDPDFPAVRGRSLVFKDGHVGRFGWKAQGASLHEFVLTACASELGLEVPGHHQAASPLDFEARAKGLDLSAEDCNALESYIRRLPVPVSSVADARHGSQASELLKQGMTLFEQNGCAACHTPKLGGVDGIYSDLLVHDMGRVLADGGSSYRGRVDPSPDSIVRPQDWRTPPLWGFADSAPYLHIGRANSLEEAVALHGGEALASTERFFKLLPTERLKVQAFLRSLPAPGPKDNPAR